MNLDDFLMQYPHIKRVSSPEDGQKILSFLQKHSRPQKRFHLFYDRSPDFFFLLRLSSPDHFTLTYEDEEGLQGVITFTVLKAKDFDTLYVGDFKVQAKSEKMKVSWRALADHFIEDLGTIDEFKRVKYIHMVMMDDNTKAYQRLVASNTLSFNYRKVQGYKMINVLGKKWWKFKKRTFTHSIQKASRENLYKVIQHASLHRLGADHPEFMQYRADQILSMASILEVRNPDGDILLRASLEDVKPAKRILIMNLPHSLKIFSPFFPLFGGKRYVKGSPLDILYLSNLSFHQMASEDQNLKAQVLNYAVDAVLNFSQGKYHLISLSLFHREEDLIQQINENFLTQTEPLAFYQISPTWSENIPETVLPNLNMSYI